MRPPRWLDSCDTITQVLAKIKQQDIWPGIETLFNDGCESDFYLGPIVRLTDKGFSLKCYDATGKWEKTYEIEHNKIFRIEIDSKYCNYFNSYMKAKK